MKGPKFCKTTDGRFFDFKGDTHDFSKKLMIQERFFDQSINDDSLIRNPSKKYMSTNNKEMTDIITTVNKIEPKSIHMERNITVDEEKALKELILCSKESIEIKKADKTNTLVIMDKTDYRDNLVLQQHLSTPTYETAEIDINSKVFNKLQKLTEQHKNSLTKHEKQAILNKDWEESKFYVLPKISKCEEIVKQIELENTEYIHMKMPLSLKGRPINGGPKSVTQGASKLLEKF